MRGTSSVTRGEKSGSDGEKSVTRGAFFIALECRKRHRWRFFRHARHSKRQAWRFFRHPRRFFHCLEPRKAASMALSVPREALRPPSLPLFSPSLPLFSPHEALKAPRVTLFSPPRRVPVAAASTRPTAASGRHSPGPREPATSGRCHHASRLGLGHDASISGPAGDGRQHARRAGSGGCVLDLAWDRHRHGPWLSDEGSGSGGQGTTSFRMVDGRIAEEWTRGNLLGRMK